MTDHTDLRDRIEDMLKDASNADWSTTELDNALRIALHELSVALPSRAATTIDAVAETWEYSIAAVTGLLEVVEVWYPYLATDESYKKARPVKWRMLTDSVLLLDEKLDPDATYDLRVFYDQLQTLAGLDSAAATTLNAQEKSALVFGAAGYAAISLGVDKIDKVVIGGAAAEDLRKWGWARIMEFRLRVADLAAVADSGEDASVSWGPIDKWDT